MADITVISGTIQEFNGERFYLCGQYFQHHGKRLHRMIWEYYNGPIPEGYHVHHIDEDRHNNEIENLSLMPGIEHARLHMTDEKRVAESKKAIERARVAACKWHGSPDGFEFHSKLAKQTWEQIKPLSFKCDYCGKEYQTRAQRRIGNHFCSGRCKAAYRRKRLRDNAS